MPPASGQCAQLYLKLPGAKPLSALALSHCSGDGFFSLLSRGWPSCHHLRLWCRDQTSVSLSGPVLAGSSTRLPRLLAQPSPPAGGLAGGLAGGTGPHSPGRVWGHRPSAAGPALAECQSRALPGAHLWPGPSEPLEETPRPASPGFPAVWGGGADGQRVTLLVCGGMLAPPA